MFYLFAKDRILSMENLGNVGDLNVHMDELQDYKTKMPHIFFSCLIHLTPVNLFKSLLIRKAIPLILSYQDLLMISKILLYMTHQSETSIGFTAHCLVLN